MMEAEIIALSACCRELFPIMDMVSSVTKSVKLPIGRITMNVSIHEDNSGALVLAKTLPPQFTPPQLRRFGFVKKSSREMCNYLKLTQPNNWVISLRKVSHVLFLNISERRLWDGNSLDASLFECISSSLERECRTRSWGPGYIVGYII